jgi:hypothetical protein
MLKKTTAIAGALAMAGIVAWSAPAAAETAPPAAAAVPGCVTTALNDTGGRDELTVYNNCSYSVRVKVVLANGSDAACRTIAARSSHNYWWNWPRRFDGLVSC